MFGHGDRYGIRICLAADLETRLRFLALFLPLTTHRTTELKKSTSQLFNSSKCSYKTEILNKPYCEGAGKVCL